MTNLINSSPELAKSFQKIRAIEQKEYNWNEVYSNPGIINEYAAFIDKQGSHIEPLEIKIMAHLFKKQVNFYTSGGYSL